MAYKLNMTGQEFEYKIKNPQPFNLLDNSNFTSLVNQRGQNSYTADWGYTIDRWRIQNPTTTVSISDQGINISSDQKMLLYQIINPERIKYNTPYTFVAYLSDNTMEYINLTTLETSPNSWYWVKLITMEKLNLGFAQSLNGQFLVAMRCVTESTWITKCALYEGEFNEKTLPEYQPKGYAVELAECQRYYQRKTCQRQIVTYAQAGFEAVIDLYAPMRATPSANLITAPVWIRMGGTHIALSDVTIKSVIGGKENLNALVAFNTSVNRAANEVGYVDAMTIEFSADLK